jgi:hypothetical protein
MVSLRPLTNVAALKVLDRHLIGLNRYPRVPPRHAGGVHHVAPRDPPTMFSPSVSGSV